MKRLVLAVTHPTGHVETKPTWMLLETWECRMSILRAGDDAHWAPLLHIHIEDRNLDDWWFDRNDEAFAERAEQYRDAEQWERDIFDALGALTEDQRYQAVTGMPCPASCYDPERGCPYTDCPA